MPVHFKRLFGCGFGFNKKAFYAPMCLAKYMFKRHGMKCTSRVWNSARLQKYDEFKKDPNCKQPGKKAQELGFKGWYRCCLFKWKKDRVNQSWDLIVKAAPSLAKRLKEVPNRIRAMFGQPGKFLSRKNGQGTTALIPRELQDAVTETVAARQHLHVFLLFFWWGVSLYIYIYTYRERERERPFPVTPSQVYKKRYPTLECLRVMLDIYIYIYTFLFIYIFIHIYMPACKD